MHILYTSDFHNLTFSPLPSEYEFKVSSNLYGLFLFKFETAFSWVLNDSLVVYSGFYVFNIQNIAQSY